MNINLKELVLAIRDELEQLDQARIMAKKAPLFHLTNLELELNFTVVESDSTKGGFDLKVISFGDDSGTKTEEIQKITLKFQVPADAKSSPVLGGRAHGGAQVGSDTDISLIE
jgi:hypothetical protein